jgi:hypothetical protein
LYTLEHNCAASLHKSSTNYNKLKENMHEVDPFRLFLTENFRSETVWSNYSQWIKLIAL